MNKEFILLSSQLQGYFSKFGYIGVYIWFITVDQIVPIPEEITLIVIGYLSSQGLISPILAGIFSIAAFITVDTVYFQLTLSGNKLIQKITSKTQGNKTNKYKEQLKNHTFKTLLILSFIPRMRLFGPVFVALLKIPYKRFLLYDIASLALFTSIYIALGVLFHKSLSSLISKTQSLTNIIFFSAIGVMVVLTVVMIKKFRK